MHDDLSRSRLDAQISRRSLLRGGLAAAALTGLPSCAGAGAAVAAAARSRVPGNVRVSRDSYGVHVEPSVAANPRDPRQLLATCQASRTPNPEFIATYVSLDGGASWQHGGVPPKPSGAADGDDITVAFDPLGRGYVCATTLSHARDTSVYLWRTDDGGRSFSEPLTLLEGQYHDHPWVATGEGQAPSERNVYAAWAASTSISAPSFGTALGFTRSTDGGRTFESPRTILPQAPTLSVESAGPQLAAGPDGLVCATCFWSTVPHRSGDFIGQVVAVCSTDAGRSFAAPVQLGSGVSDIQLPGDVKPNSSPTVAISPRGDALYVAFPTHDPGATHSDIVVSASRDRGRTWSRPIRATPTDDVVYFQPNLAVDDAGRVAISAFALANGRVNQVLLLSRPGELHFQPPLQVTTAAFDPHSPTESGQKHGAWWIGDYQGITAGAEGFQLVWNDARNGKLELFAATVHP